MEGGGGGGSDVAVKRLAINATTEFADEITTSLANQIEPGFVLRARFPREGQVKMIEKAITRQLIDSK